VFGRSQTLWGEDALEFKPTRWLDPTTHTGIMQVSPYKFITFNAGYVNVHVNVNVTGLRIYMLVSGIAQS
jgi:hypothetical protein